MGKRKPNNNYLSPENCNKVKCKTCIFRTDGNQLELPPDRMAEIQSYLARGESSHICHTTEHTCYGALEYQAMIFHRMGIIPENSVDSLLQTAKKYLDEHNKSSSTEE